MVSAINSQSTHVHQMAAAAPQQASAKSQVVSDADHDGDSDRPGQADHDFGGSIDLYA